MSIKKSIALLLLLFITITSASCGKKVDNTDNTPIDQNPVNNEQTDQDDKPKPYINPLTGLETSKETLQRLPFAIMINNHSHARPQASLDQAEVVFEILAEGGITRLMALYLEKQPTLAGPVRSARYYYLDKALEFNSIYIHAGGSSDAVADIEKLKVKSLSSLKTGDKMFFRRNDRKVAMEHTLYVNLEYARELAQTKGYEGTSESLNPFVFSEKSQPTEGAEATSIEIKYHSNNVVAYQYQDQEGRYFRSINEKPHIDELSQKQISAKNIIIQIANTSTRDNGTMEIDLVATGTGRYLSNGKAIDITWKKDGRNDKTYYYDQEGQELTINPGNTWIQVVPQYAAININ